MNKKYITIIVVLSIVILGLAIALIATNVKYRKWIRKVWFWF